MTSKLIYWRTNKSLGIISLPNLAANRVANLIYQGRCSTICKASLGIKPDAAIGVPITILNSKGQTRQIGE